MATWVLDVDSQTWTMVNGQILEGGSAVMYRPGKIMKAGSSYRTPDPVNVGPSKATTYVLDMTQGAPAWQQTASMANPRTHLNLTVLPDGNVMAIGGSTQINGWYPNDAVYPTEMWSPTTQTWTTMASIQHPRMYHSTALLLPDGRVLSAGGGRNGVTTADYLNAQFYSPPYLFNGARPTISSAPSTLAYNSSFFVGTPDSANIASVALIRNGAVTHSFDMNQRFVPLSFSQVAGGLNVQAPADANLAPPGHYMLFIVNSAGVPSIAPFVRLPAAYEDSQPPTAPGNLMATGAIGTATLSWTASTDNVGVHHYNVHRSTTSGFVPSAANRIAQPTTTGYVDARPAGTYYYKVTAEDVAGNVSAASNQATAVVTADTTPPSVTLTSPANAATVSGVITVTANASDNVGVVGVQFLLDGNDLGLEDTGAPYSTSWNTATVSNGQHVLTARARDAAGNTATSSVTVTVGNITPAGLVLALGFNEGMGGTVADVSGNANNGTISNATWTTAGKFGNALSFNGSNARVNINDANSIDLTAGMTLEAWVRPSAINGWETIIMKERPGGLAYSLYGGSPTGPPASYITRTGTSSDIGANGTATLPLNTWSHLAATYDGTTIRLYVNGGLVSSQVAAGSIMVTSNPLRIGGNTVFSSEYFAGRIDEVRIYNRALSVAEIQADMDTPVLPPVILPGDYNSDQVVNSADYVVWRKFLGSTVVLPNDTTPGSVTTADLTVWRANFGSTVAGLGLPASLPGDYNSDQIVDTGDYVVWRKTLGSTAILPNDSTPGSVTAEDLDVWKANYGASAGQGQQSAGSGSTTAGVSAVVELPTRHIRRSVRLYGSRDVGLTQFNRASLLLASLETSVESVHRETTSRSRQIDLNDESANVGDFSFKAIDEIFAELGQSPALRRRAR
jgi:hypothetical protein